MRTAFTLARLTVLEALRTRLLWIALVLDLAAFGLAQFLQQVALTESRSIAAALLAALLRAAAVFIASSFAIATLIRESNDRVTDLILSLPEPRAFYLLGKFGGCVAVSLALAIVFALPLLPYGPGAGLAAWTASLACELAIMVAVSLFCAQSLAQPPAAFAAAAGFYVLGRCIAAIQVIADAPLAEPTRIDRVIGRIVDSIALLMPSLDRMTETAWLVNAPPSAAALGEVAAQTLIYVILIVSAALFDLYRRNL